MTSPSAKIIADSISHAGHRLTTFEVTFHRIILAEVNTHRMLSRNSASSRAIPITVKLDEFINDPALPVFWPAERPGMQAKEELTGDDLFDAQDLFTRIRELTAREIYAYIDAHPEKETRLHKSWLNRPLEWASWQTAVISSTEWDNFFGLRCSPLAQPEFEVVANLMRDALASSTPKEIDQGEWHLPYVNGNEKLWAEYQPDISFMDTAKAVSVARCCRVSTVKQGEKRDVDADIKLFNTLRDPGEGLPHASPLEHVATPCPEPPRKDIVAGDPAHGWHNHKGNFVGWDQLRHEVLGF